MSKHTPTPGTESIVELMAEPAWQAFHESNKPAPFNQMRDALHAAISALEQAGYAMVPKKPADMTAVVVTELETALAIADKVLERPFADPDDNLAILARALIELSQITERR